MSVMSDRWITVQSTKPTGLIHMVGGDKVPVVKIDEWYYSLDHGKYYAPHADYHPFDDETVLFNWKPMIEPFIPEQIKAIDEDSKLISYGTSSYGYDVRLGDEISIFSNIHSVLIDPKRFNRKCLVEPIIQTDEWGDRYVTLPPNSYLLGPTIEYFRIPRDVLVVVLGKSTYARSGISLNCTPIEPGFHGHVVLEVANHTTLPAKIYVGEGIAQFIFLKGNEPCRVSYDDRDGKYQGQTGLTFSKV